MIIKHKNKQTAGEHYTWRGKKMEKEQIEKIVSGVKAQSAGCIHPVCANK